MSNRLIALSLALVVVSVATRAAAHCDTIRGPVVAAAIAALDEGNPRLVLHWVRAEDEAAVTRVFEHVLAVRALGPEARELADRYFFETIVRIHREGEGAPYLGLSDGPPDRLVAATDQALELGSASRLEEELVGAVRSELSEKFARAKAARASFTRGDVTAGRAYVAAYVSLTHWVEGVAAAADAQDPHAAEPTPREGAPARPPPHEHGHP